MKGSLIPAVLSALLASLLPEHSRADGVVVQWEKIYNGTGNRDDWPEAVALDSAGNVIVTGSSYRVNSIADVDIYTAKYAAGDGALLWDRRYDGPATNDIANPFALAVDRAGNVIVTGSTGTDTGGTDGYTAKYAATNGALLWENRYHGPVGGYGEFRAVALDSADNVIVTGRVATYRSPTSNFGDDFYTAKYASANGALLWEKIYRPSGTPQEDDAAERVAVDSSDNVIVSGSSENLGITVVKYAAANGAFLWSMRPPDMTAYDILSVDSADNVIVAGQGIEGIHTAKYAAENGALLWDKRYNLIGQDPILRLAVKVDGDGTVIVTVATRDLTFSEPSNVTLKTVKYAGTGGLLISEDQNYYRFPGIPNDIKLDGAGNALVTGYITNIYDIYTAKYASGSGSLLWEMRYNGRDNLRDWGDRLLLDESGSVIVVGRTNTESNTDGSDFYTVKYTPMDLDLDDDGLLDSWETEHFGDIAIHSALDDTDGDGSVELLELAFGTDPRVANSLPAPSVVIEGGYLTTTITKQPCVRYLVETGATLEAGFSATNTTVLTDTASTLKVRDNVLIGTQPARFLRVQITAAP